MNENEPRVPAGQSGGGEWTSGGAPAPAAKMTISDAWAAQKVMSQAGVSADVRDPQAGNYVLVSLKDPSHGNMVVREVRTIPSPTQAAGIVSDMKKRCGYNADGIHPSHLAMGKGTLQTISCGMPTPKCM